MDLSKTKVGDKLICLNGELMKSLIHTGDAFIVTRLTDVIWIDVKGIEMCIYYSQGIHWKNSRIKRKEKLQKICSLED